VTGKEYCKFYQYIAGGFWVVKQVKGILIGMAVIVFFVGVLDMLNVVNLEGSFITPVMALCGIALALRLELKNKVLIIIFKLSFSALAVVGLALLFVKTDVIVDVFFQIVAAILFLLVSLLQKQH
jgi:hypothetical protein